VVAHSTRITAEDLERRLAGAAGPTVVDVRNVGETRVGGMIPGAVNIPVAALRDRLDELDPGEPTVVHCAGGYRSILASSLLERAGFVDVADLIGGYGAWSARQASEGAPTG
jgi:hydroxyacylglutathione hydrolase